MRNALYSPFVSRLNPKRRWISVGNLSCLMGALSGKRGFDTVRVETTFLWMSETERVEGVHLIFFLNIADRPTDLQMN
jgi:hypothetical protein